MTPQATWRVLFGVSRRVSDHLLNYINFILILHILVTFYLYVCAYEVILHQIRRLYELSFILHSQYLMVCYLAIIWNTVDYIGYTQDILLCW